MQPTESSSSLHTAAQEGRPLVTATVHALDRADTLRATHLELQSHTIDPTKLRFLPHSENPQLDESAPENQVFLSRSRDLDELHAAVAELLQSCPPGMSALVGILSTEVDDTIRGHKQLLIDARLFYRATEDEYSLRGHGAPKLEPDSPTLPYIHPLHIGFLLLSSMLYTMMGLSHTTTLLVMKCIRALVKLAFIIASAVETGDPTLPDLLRHIPVDPRVGISRCLLLPEFAVYACCPQCCHLYKPLDEDRSQYPTRCANIVDGQQCDTPLVRSCLEGDQEHWRAILRFPVRDLEGWTKSLVSRPDIEAYINGRLPEPDGMRRDLWEAEYLATFVGPDGLPFFNGSGRLAFALAIDWFNPETNLEAKKKWSIGAVYAVCLNLPPHLRFRLENVCLVAIIPGPQEPSLDQLNHFLRPIVDSFLRLWNPGCWITRTQRHPMGSHYRVILVILAADLLGARQTAGFTFPGHWLFCSYCTLPRDRMDELDPAKWPRGRSLETHRAAAQEWLAASSADWIGIADQTGTRYSELNRLPYFNPFKAVVVDLLHLFLAVLSKHARGAWHMNIAVEAGDGSNDPFYHPPDIMTMAKAEHAMRTMGKTDLLKSRIAKGWLDSEGKIRPADRGIPFTPPVDDELEVSGFLEKDAAVIFAAERRIFHDREPVQKIKREVKAAALRSLCKGRGLDYTGSKDKMLELLAPPKNLGDPKQGKLSSKEWRSIFLVSFLTTLVRLWGQEYDSRGEDGKKGVLDNYLHLACAVMLAMQGQLTDKVIEMYEFHMRAHLEGFKVLYPTHSIIPYHHLSLHVPDFMKLLGSWNSWGTGPYEMYNGMAQKITTNSVFGDLEISIFRQFAAASRLRAVFLNGNLPDGLDEFAGHVNTYLEKSKLGGMARNSSCEGEPSTEWIAFPLNPTAGPQPLSPALKTTLESGSPGIPVPNSAFMCDHATRGGVSFTISSKSARDSQISIFLIIRPYAPLIDTDAQRDPYRNHPLVGSRGYALCEAAYDEFLPEVHVIEAKHLIGHVVRCTIDLFSKPAIVLVHVDNRE
ncbi:hypothetical protein FRC05_005138 [Tulasnella sp. 425]|nr:hypothetical protein FRC05_005138 [Tulasnella sp. 425]